MEMDEDDTMCDDYMGDMLEDDDMDYTQDFYQMDAEMMMSVENEAKRSCDEDYSFQILTVDGITQLMIDCIKEVSSVAQIPVTTTRILLTHFKWDREKLMECYYSGDQEKFFSQAHVVNPFKSIEASKGEPAENNTKSSGLVYNQESVCEICYLTVSNAQLTGLECGHKFCSECWGVYLTTKILDEGMGETISCPSPDCKILVDYETIMNLVSNQKAKQIYQSLITNSFVECNKLLQWCPTPDCNHALKVQHFGCMPVTCVCHLTFCFACGKNWHDPVNCTMLQKWIKKNEDDSETARWISINTRECPNCHASIQKNGGCNQMVCKKCKSGFCWACLKLTPIMYMHVCTTFNEEVGQKADTRAALERFLFYSRRYTNHLQSLKFEQKLYDTTKLKMKELQSSGMSWIEVQFLKQGVDVLCQCRQTLMYTYAFAFYLQSSNHSIIFEANQKDLENATEQLSGYLERELTSEQLVDIKQKVQDKCRYCETRRKALLDHVHEGQENNLWEYLETD